MQAARRELAGKNMDLKESSPKFEYNKPKSTNWPDARRSRHLSIQVPSPPTQRLTLVIWYDEEVIEE